MKQHLIIMSGSDHHVSFLQAQLPSISSLCKNEIYPLPLSRFVPLVLEIEPSFHLPDSHSSYPSGEHFRISNQFFRLGMEEESSNETKLGGHVKPLATMLRVSFSRNHAGGKIPTSVYNVNVIFQAEFTHWFQACVKMKPIFEHSFN